MRLTIGRISHNVFSFSIFPNCFITFFMSHGVYCFRAFFMSSVGFMYDLHDEIGIGRLWGLVSRL